MIQPLAVLLLLLAVVGGPAATAVAAPEGQLTPYSTPYEDLRLKGK